MNFAFNKGNPYHLISLFVTVFLLLAIPLTVATVLTVEKTGRSPKAATGRDPLKQPFASWSIWNLPIGASAQYKPSNIKDWTATGVFLEENFIFNNHPGSVLTDVVANNTGWDSGSRCGAQGGNIFGGVKLNLPSNFIIADRDGNNTPNNASAILSPDGKKYYQTQPLTHCNSSSPWTALPYNHTIVDIDKDGIEGDQGGSGMSSVGGAIRVGEWKAARTAGKFPHALKTVLDSSNFGNSSGPDCSGIPGCRWPAVASDCGNQACGYGGGSAQNHVKMGSLLALKPDFNCAGLRTEPGRIVCQTLKDYGMYIVDSGWDPAYLPVEYGPAGYADQDFRTEFGFDMADDNANSPWSQDWRQMVTTTNVVDNWNLALYNQVKASNGSLGAGGGAPRVAWAPEIGSSTTPPPPPPPPPPPLDTVPPTVSVSSPTNGQTISGTVSLAANASDNVGVARVEFLANGNLLTTDSVAPYSFNLDTKTLANGQVTLLAKAYDAANNIGQASISVTVNNQVTSNLPLPWVTGDIGSVGVVGSASVTNTVFTVVGSGADIWGTADSFRYVFQDLIGDGVITARVTAQSNSNSWAKAGVMIRDSLTANSANAMVINTPSNGQAFQYRASSGATTNHVAAGSSGLPVWLRIQRSGNVITAFRSTDGANFSNVGSTNLQLQATAKVGLIVTSHDNSTTSEAKFDNVTVAKSATNAPTISGITAEASETTATIKWTTDQAATSVVDYGTSTLLGTPSQPDESLTTSHLVNLSGLKADTTYLYRVKSTNSGGQTAMSGILSFKTKTVSAINSLEAETLKVTSGWVDSSGNIFSDNNASAGKGLILWGNSGADGLISGSGNRLVIRARGDQCQGSPNMVVASDGVLVLQTSVSSTSWTDYTAAVSLGSGIHAISITFNNDLWDGGSCDRNLRLDKITINTADTPVSQASLEAEKTTLSGNSVKIFSDSAASGGLGVVLYSTGNIVGNLSGSGSKIVVRARGDQCDGSPRMVLSIDGKEASTNSVTSKTWTDYTTTTSVGVGTHTIKIVFDNDLWKGAGTNCDRNLRVDKITLQ